MPTPNIRPKKNGFEARIMIHGKRWTAYGATESQAANNLAEKVESHHQPVDSTTLRSLMETVYLPTLTRASQKQREKVAWSVKHLGRHADIPLTRLDRQTFQRIINAKTQSPGTIRTMVSCWSAALNLAEADGIIPSNPLRHVKLPRDEPKIKEVLSASELLALIEASRGYSGHPLVVLGGLMGLRIGEVQAITVDSFREGQLHVPGTKSAASARILPLPPAIHSELANLEIPLLPPNQSANRNALLRNAKRAGIVRRVHPHLLRHTCLTLLQWLGCPIETRARIAGHTQRHITQRYSHAEWREMERWLGELCAYVYRGGGELLGNGPEIPANSTANR